MLRTEVKYGLSRKRNVPAEIINTLLKDKMFFAVLTAIFIKTILFIWFLGTVKIPGFNISCGFYSFPPFFVYLSFIAIILSFSFLFNGRGHIWALVVIDIVFTILVIGDNWYNRGFSGFLNFYLLSQTTNLNNLGSSVISMFRPIDIIYVLDIVFLISFIIFKRNFYRGVRLNKLLFLITFIVPILYLTYAHYKVDVFKRGFEGQMLFTQSWSPYQTMSNLGPVGYHIYDGYKYYLNTRPYDLTQEEREAIGKWYDKKSENLPDNKYFGMFKGKNLLVIQFESLENFVIDQKIQGQEITPNLNRLLKNSYYFNNYHENVYNGTSSDADLMTNAGVYPVREGSTFFRYPNNSYKHSLPRLLGDMGYSTLAIHPDKGSYWNWMPSLKSIGFERCIDEGHFDLGEQIGLGLADHSFLKQVVPIIDEDKRPFYNFMVTLSSHTPFDLPEKYQDMKLTEDFNRNILGKYFQSIHYTDKALGAFIDELEKKGILKDTVVVIYGDHTSVNKFYPDRVSEVKPSEDWWMNNDMRIPLIIYNPEVKGETLSIQGGQIDLMPTLAYLMGVKREKYEKSALGKVLFNTNKNYTILQNFKMYGDYTPEDEKQLKDGILLSDKMVQSNYFKDKQGD